MHVFRIVSFLCLLVSCSSGKEKPSPISYNNVPFEDLHVVRVLIAVISDNVNRETVTQTAINEFTNMGEIHTPDGTSVEMLLKAQEKPFAIFTLNINELATISDEICPIIILSCSMLELSKLTMNNKEWMSNVWEKTRYIKILSDQKATTEKVKEELKKLIMEFAAQYNEVNEKNSKISFYIGNPL